METYDTEGAPKEQEEEAPGNLADLTRKAAELKDEIDSLSTELESKEKQFGIIKATILKTLELMDLEQVRGHGFLFFKEHKSSVQTPKTPEEKRALFAFLQEQGMFLEFASVNSQTLNALYKTLAEKAEKEGNFDFKIPGVSEPTIYTNLKMRRSK